MPTQKVAVVAGVLAVWAAAGFASRHWIISPLLLLLLLVVVMGWLPTGRSFKRLYIMCKTLPRDLAFLKRFLPVIAMIWWRKKRGHTVPQQFEAAVARHPDKAAFCFEGRRWTFREVSELSNRLGRVLLARGLARGDAVAVFMDSRPELACAWLGLAKGGVVAALINSNLRAAPLVHCIRAAACRAVIVGGELAEALEEVLSELGDIMVYQWNEDAKDSERLISRAVHLGKALSTVDASSLLDTNIRSRDRLLYLYTSGTTGLPKAAIITHLRFLLLAAGLPFAICLKQNDVLYNPLPLYHLAGGVAGVGQAIINGLTVVICRKFSASKFWSDCVENNCTVAQYIGEICRYLLAAPMKDEEKKHKLRLIFGSGLRQQIWQSFSDRFNLRQIYEIYGSSEGNATMANIDNTTGAVGFIPNWFAPIYPLALIRMDKDNGEPIRRKNGLCITCKPGECGVLVGKIDSKLVTCDFSGYTDQQATEKKVLRDVFKIGDKYFNTGDVFEMDDLGYLYFRDRGGDTYRWHGENVSTTEVEAIISNIIDLNDAAVYGVQVPNTEGKAGMAAIVNESGNLDLVKLAEGMKRSLPKYAIPLFLRVSRSLPKTATFRMKKQELAHEGFDPNVVPDSLFFFQKLETYVPLTADLYNDIVIGKVRL